MDLPPPHSLDLRLANAEGPNVRAGGGIGRGRPPAEPKGGIMRAPVVGVVGLALMAAVVLAPVATSPTARAEASTSSDPVPLYVHHLEIRPTK